mgnify:CR=1 FL=1
MINILRDIAMIVLGSLMCYFLVFFIYLVIKGIVELIVRAIGCA